MADDPTPPDADGERASGEEARDPDSATTGTTAAPGDGGGETDDESTAVDGTAADEPTGDDVDRPADVDGTVDVDADGAGDDEAIAEADEAVDAAGDDLPADVRKYARFKKVDGAQYDRVNDFLRERTYITAREWAIARLCADFRTETGVEMTKIGESLDVLVPFMEDTYTPQAVNQARSSFEEKVHKAGATFLYGAMCDFFTAEELDELMYEVTEVAKFLLEVEGVDLSVEEELAAEDRISGVMREVRAASEALRYEECPHCGEQLHE
jgi:hypothetical protein